MFLVMQATIVLLGLFLIVSGLFLRRMNAKAASWRSTEGEITESAVVVDRHDGSSNAEIRYRYVVNGNTFSSGQFSFGVRENAPATEQRLVAAFPVGHKVKVYYDPQNPSIAVIERRSSSRWAIFVTVGAVFVAVGLLAR